MRYAVIDIGTNSVRYLLAEKAPEGILHISTDIATTRLGEGLYSAERRLQEPNMAATVSAVARFARHGREQGAGAIYCIATSAARDATNGEELQRRIREAASVEVEIISGKEEAALGIAGALSDCDAGQAPILVDIGGGSTEIVELGPEGLVLNSFQCGAVRLRELCKTWSEADRYMEEHIQLPPVLRPGQSGAARGVLWIGGTASAAAMIYCGKRTYEDLCVHMTQLPGQWILDFAEKCRSASNEQLAQWCCFEPKRAQILPYGMQIMARIVRELGVNAVTVSEKGLMDGVLQKA